MANNTSQHILNTSASLLGFCLFVITSFKIGNKLESSIIDDLTSAVAILLGFSCFFSFFSIRTNNLVREKRLETMADYFFIVSLSGIIILILLIILNVIK
jgi:uncharacterized membrane protein